MSTVAIVGLTATVAVTLLALERRIREGRGLRVVMETTGDMVRLSVTNMNRTRTKRLQSIGGRAGRMDFRLSIPDFSLPRALEPEETVTLEISHSLLLRSDLRWVGVWDSTGRATRAPRRAVASLVREGIVVRCAADLARVASSADPTP